MHRRACDTRRRAARRIVDVKVARANPAGGVGESRRRATAPSNRPNSIATAALTSDSVASHAARAPPSIRSSRSFAASASERTRPLPRVSRSAEDRRACRTDPSALPMSCAARAARGARRRATEDRRCALARAIGGKQRRAAVSSCRTESAIVADYPCGVDSAGRDQQVGLRERDVAAGRVVRGGEAALQLEAVITWPSSPCVLRWSRPRSSRRRRAQSCR